MPNRHDVEVDDLTAAILKAMQHQKLPISPAEVAALVAQELPISFTDKANWIAFRHSVIYRLQLLEAAGKMEAVTAKHGKKKWRIVDGVCGQPPSADSTN